MNSYPSYKDSGVEWIGEIPSHWGSIKLKYIGFLFGGLSGKSGKDFNNDENPNNKPFIPFTNICDNIYISKNNLGMVNISEDEKQNRVEKNDLFFLMSSEDQEGIGKPSVLKDELGEVYLNTFCRGFRITDEKYDSLFVNYLLSGHSYRELLSVEGRGFTRINLRSHKVSNFQIHYPPKETQTQIVSFLDTKTQKIDDFIHKTEKKIELLKEKRTSLINHCVTKGLNPNVEMKDSGVEWIGEIPSHWVKSPIKHISVIYGRIGFRGYKTSDIVDEGEGVITLSPSNIKDGQLVLSKRTYLSYEKYYESPEIIIKPDDIIYVQRGSTIGKVTIIPTDSDEMTINPQLIILKENKVNSRYLYYLMMSDLITIQTIINIKGGSTPLITQDNVENFKIVYTQDLKEQTQIVEYLDEQTQNIDTTIEKESQRIELLKEYRQSLISEVVTGKVDVRDWKE